MSLVPRLSCGFNAIAPKISAVFQIDVDKLRLMLKLIWEGSEPGSMKTTWQSMR